MNTETNFSIPALKCDVRLGEVVPSSKIASKPDRYAIQNNTYLMDVITAHFFTDAFEKC